MTEQVKKLYKEMKEKKKKNMEDANTATRKEGKKNLTS